MNLKTKQNEHFLMVLLIIITLLWLILYIIPETFASLFNTILGKLILILIVTIVSLHNIVYGIIIVIILIIFYRFVDFTKKEGFTWSPKTLYKFLELENTINRGLVFDTNVTQQQASEKEVKYFLKNGTWPWSKKVEELYKEAVSKNPFIRTDMHDSLKYAKSVYNQNAILELIALQTNEGKTLLNGVEKYVPIYEEELPYAYNSGLIARENSVIKCNTNDTDNAVMEQRTMPPMGSLNSPTITEISYTDLENAIPGFKFIKNPCNPCSPLNQIPDYNCPFSIKTKNNPTGEISKIWQYLWNLKPIKHLTISKTIPNPNM